MLSRLAVAVDMGHQFAGNAKAIFPQLADNFRAIACPGYAVDFLPCPGAIQQGGHNSPLAGGVDSGKLGAVEGAQFCFFRGLGVFHFRVPPARGAIPLQAMQDGH